jgi:thioredoxin 1
MPAIEVTDETFERDVLSSASPVLVDFWAPWCRPCKAIEPVLEELAAARPGRVRLVRVNIDENHGVPSRYGVLSIPTVILFEGGEAKATVVGARSRKGFEKALGPHLPPEKRRL